MAISSHSECIEKHRRTKEGVLKKPDHTTGGIAADPGHPVSGPPGETIGGEIGEKRARTLLNEVIFSTSEAEKFTSVRAGPVGSVVGDFMYVTSRRRIFILRTLTIAPTGLVVPRATYRG